MCPQEYNDNFKEKLIRFCKKTWAYIKLARVEWIVILGVIFLDLLSKGLVEKLMREGQTITLIPKFLNFHFTYNTAAAFSFDFGLGNLLGATGVRIVFLIVTAVAVAVFFIFMFRFKRGHILARLSLALIISGAIGNFYDRLFIHKVRDFIEFVYFGLDLPLLGESFAIFNIADSALTVGVVLFAVYFIFMYKPGVTDFVGPIMQKEDSPVEPSTQAQESAQTDNISESQAAESECQEAENGPQTTTGEGAGAE